MTRRTRRAPRPRPVTGRMARGCQAAALVAAVGCQPAPARAAPPPPSVVRASGVVTWAASADGMGEDGAGQGYRMIVHTSVGGTGLRVRVTNAFGDHPLTLDSGYAGLRGHGAALRPGSNRRLTFGGARTVTVPAGAAAWSDPLPGSWPAGTDLAVSLYLPGAAGPATGHWMALQTSYTGQGDHTAEESARNWGRTTGSWWYLDAVSVRPSRAATGAVVVLGDSLTDGRQSTPDLNRRWPDYLARRLNPARTHAMDVRGVADEGVSGNMVLTDGAAPSALDRLDRDVLSQPGVRTVFLFEGVNDLKAHTGVTAAELIAGYREIARRVHGAGKCVVAATVGPFKGWPEWDPAAESVRRDVNRLLRTSRDFDAVIDFDRVLRSPDDPERLRPAFDGGDHLHPDDRGMRALADAVDLARLNCAR
ncbi:SGNH/GDSL hydrolase family protein [Streptomyces alanosinicus]|uniref:SGNH hydrolase n=1 Tax=Streptomyces alanosinicus TaxID=68171 RepID=A0A919D501_9ACTN|nr:SGNH/GDSL hydrolase family protein [Streptomyces alanosinicus]GHE07869.1 SGNH hydrolase [Streptomyces alanosinicus]